MWRGRVDLEHVLALIEHLPDSARIHRIEGFWTYERIVATYHANLARLELWHVANLGNSKPDPQPELLPMPSTGEDTEPGQKPNLLRDLLASKRAALDAEN